MEKSFEDALNDLLTVYQQTDRDEVISALELALMALKEDE